jgi:hypothetical protein
MSAFTPGPWEYNDPATYRQGFGKFSETAVYAPGNAFHWRMAEVQGPDEQTEIATARLIAAAPDMLAALRETVLQLEYLADKFGETGSGAATLAKVNAAIRKATES